MESEQLTAVAARLAEVPGVVAVSLGGSRARGTHRPDSDVDLGIYYRGDLDVAALRALAGGAEVTEPGGWGPWVDGGGWLTEGEWRVDWIYRDLDRVHAVWDACRAGTYEVATQAGHPLGFYSHTYAGEVALCRVLADPTCELSALKAVTAEYPAALGEALVAGLWEAGFLTANAVKGDDPVYAAGCLFRAVGVLCHAMHGHAGKWLLNEKGMVASADALGIVPGFGERARSVLSGLGDVKAAVETAEALAGDVRLALA